MKLDCVAILRTLVSFRTVSRDSNLPLIDWVRNYLLDLGIESHLVPNADGTKSNLFATVGPAAPGGLVLSGHTDVVPVDGQKWSSDPFELTVRGTRLHGRGSAGHDAGAGVVESFAGVGDEGDFGRGIIEEAAEVGFVHRGGDGEYKFVLGMGIQNCGGAEHLREVELHLFAAAAGEQGDPML